MAVRMAIFAATALVCAALVFGWPGPGNAAAFLNRLFLGPARYPTRTVIGEIVSPGEKSAYGRPVVFAVRVGGERPLPRAGRVQVETVSTGLDTTIELLPDEKSPDLFVGTLDRVLDDLVYTVYVGDDRKGPRRLKLIPLPLAQFERKVITPPYARARARAPTGPGSRRHVVVLEGSTVVPIVTADKKLVRATLTLEDTKKTVPMTARGEAFVLDGPASPLARVTRPVHFHIDITDADGLSPENPIKGVVQVSADLPPRVALGAFSQLVVPQAVPELRVKAIDDYALEQLTRHRTIIRADGTETRTSDVLVRTGADGGLELAPRLVLRPGPDGKVRRAAHLPALDCAYTLLLADLALQKGDQVVVAVEAADYRGKAQGKTKRSEKWVFDVTDREGVLRGMARLPEEMDKKLDEVLRAELSAMGGE